MAGLIGSIAAALLALVAMLQGAAWLGPRRARPRTVLGASLCSMGVLLLVGALLLQLAPGFFESGATP